MGTQDNFSQSKEMGRHCVNTVKSLCTQGNRCVDTTLFDWLELSCVHIGFCVLPDTGFSCVSLCQEFFSS